MKAALLVLATAPAAADPWVQPVDEARLTAAAYDEADRPYTTPARPRDLAGGIALSCEHVEGRPCGDGARAFAELDSSAGDDWWHAGTRLRLGTDGFAVDRAHVEASYRGFGVELGRDTFALGPSPRTNVGWSDHAVPLDFARASYASERGGLFYAVGRLRDPQTYQGTLVTIARGELAFGPVTLGGMQLLELEGDGAPHLGPWQFIEEHVTRTDASAGPDDSSNRRVGLDVSADLGFTRIYYELMFEDWRRQFADALRYDADHVLGFVAGPLLIELQKTGFRSQEHTPRVTGFTNAGRTTGSPLGPDADAIYLARAFGFVTPWVEYVRLSSDTYSYAYHQPIDRLTEGPVERRYRAGAFATYALDRHVRIEASVLGEVIDHFGFTGPTRHSIGGDVTVAWRP